MRQKRKSSMKKILFLAFSAILCLQSQAQIVSSRSSMTTTEVINQPEQPKNGWSTFNFEYLPSTFSPDKGDSQSFTGLALTWLTASNITPSLPLYLETGLGVQYSFYSESEDSKYGNSEEKFNMISLKMPINLIFNYQIPNTAINIDPYIGIRLRGNILGEATIENSYGDKSYNVFDKDDMGGSEYTWNRFQIGWQIGLKARFNSLIVGLGYGSDFSEIAKKVKINETQISLGVVF